MSHPLRTPLSATLMVLGVAVGLAGVGLSWPGRRPSAPGSLPSLMD